MASAKDIEVRVIPAKVANPFVKAHHYSGKCVNNSTLHLGAFLNGRLHGVMDFGPPLDKSKVIHLVEGTPWNGMLELNRMAFDDVLPKNSESRCISIAAKLIKKHASQVKWVLSFADACLCGDGTIYRASGFVLTDIRPNKNIARLPNGEEIHKLTLESSPNQPRSELGGKTYFQITGGGTISKGIARLRMRKYSKDTNSDTSSSLTKDGVTDWSCLRYRSRRLRKSGQACTKDRRSSNIGHAGSLAEGTMQPASSWRSIRPTRSIHNKCVIIFERLQHTIGRRPPTSCNLAGGCSHRGRLQMPKRIDLKGQRFGHLAVLEKAGTDKNQQVLWRCVCDCGNETTATTGVLRRGAKKSCGCKQGGFQDHTGKKFNHLTALECIGRSIDGNPIWLCRCDCGKLHKVTARNLVHGKVKSCGCLKSDGTRTTHGESDSRLYNVWNGMRQRCSNPNNGEWHNYGGRGISVCDEWQTYETFRDWALANGYDGQAKYGKCSIDRIDTDGDYTPDNCRWVDYITQGNNRRDCTRITVNGKTKTITEWARENGLIPSTIRSRIRSGWEPSRAVTQRTRQEIYHGRD